jgi:hypothetical protein
MYALDDWISSSIAAIVERNASISANRELSVAEFSLFNCR